MKYKLIIFLTQPNTAITNHFLTEQSFTGEGFFLQGTFQQCSIKKAQVTPWKEIKIIRVTK